MKRIHFLVSLLFCISVYAQNTESPYLKVLTKDASIFLSETNVEVQITGAIAHVHVSQVYKNDGNIPVESTYIFPLSTQAAVHKMDMHVGDRTIHAKIYEKQKAEKVYQKAIKEGKRAAKLDQERPNVFQMKVANLMPNDELRIDIYYTEMLMPTEGAYEFVFPTVVGPRFTGENSRLESVFHTPYIKRSDSNNYKSSDFNLSICLNAGMLIQNINSNTHEIDVNYPSSETAEIFIAETEDKGLNRDFILEYTCRGEQINSGLLLYEGEEENFFAYMMEPPSRITNNQIPSREYVFVIDVSGSMTGYPLEVSKDLMRNLLGNLRASDSFNILLFAGGSNTFKPQSVSANSANISEAIQFLSGNFGGGGTWLLNALNDAYDLPRTNTNSSRSMVIITDGYISVEKEAFEKIRNHLDEANVFTFGIGSSVNRYLIEGLSKVAHTQSYITTDKKEAYEVAKQFKRDIESPVLTQIKFEAEDFEVYDVQPSSIPDVFSSRPIVVFGKWKGKAKGKIKITGKQASGDYTKTYNVYNGTLSKFNVALKYLWARKKIELLDDLQMNSEGTKSEVVDLSLKYNLLTKYTSFVAVDDAVVNKKGNLKSIQNPIELPLNVSANAVGAEATVNGEFYVKPQILLDIYSSEELSKNENRKIKIWFKANYDDLSSKYSDEGKRIKIHFTREGRLDFVEIFSNARWNYDEDLTKEFMAQTSNIHSIKKSITITIQPNKHKPVVFITGVDKGANQFYAKAKEYFAAKNYTIVDNVYALNGIIHWLNKNDDGKLFEEIHIVTHGNGWRGIALKSTDSGDRLTNESLKSEIENGSIAKINSVLSGDTKIIFHSCGLGANKKLLSTLKKVFTSKTTPKLYASSKFAVFGGLYADFYLADVHYGFYPTANSPGKVDLAKEFSKNYPAVTIDWLSVLYKTSEAAKGSPYTYTFNIPIDWKLTYNSSNDIPRFNSKDDLIDFIVENESFANNLYALQIPVEKFRWNGAIKDNVLHIKGKVTVVCVLQPIMDAENPKEYLTLDILNKAIFEEI